MDFHLPNILVLIFHIAFIGSVTLFFLRMGSAAMISWCGFLGIGANLFVSKQTEAFGFNITCSDAYVVGYLLSTNLIQEFFGKAIAKKSILISFFIATLFALLSYIHLQYQPSVYDTTQEHFQAILTPIARITGASILSFFIVQLIDLKFFNTVREKTEGRFLTLRLLLSSFFTHSLDTLLFTYLALWGTLSSLTSILVFSILVKIAFLLLLTPFMTLSRKVYKDAAV